MNKILASIKHLPELIEGKVCIFTNKGEYKLVKPTKTTQIADNFDPMEYSILTNEKYPFCVVYSSRIEKRQFLITKRYVELFGVPSEYKNVVKDSFRVGDKIHLFSRKGIYTIVNINAETIQITCNKWRYDIPNTMFVKKEDFKCLAGGINNYAK